MGGKTTLLHAETHTFYYHCTVHVLTRISALERILIAARFWRVDQLLDEDHISLGEAMGLEQGPEIVLFDKVHKHPVALVFVDPAIVRPVKEK